MPAPLSPDEHSEAPLDAIPVLNRWARAGLVGIAAILVAVFVTAVWLNPYDVEGRPRRRETHLQLGLPPCTFRILTGIPCPSCGMTTSFSLLMHGDIVNSLRANAVGTLLAMFCLALIPWSLASALLRRFFFITTLDRALMWVVLVFVVLLLTRWFALLGYAWWTGTSL